MKKRIISLLLILCLMAVVLPIGATRAEAADVVASGGNGAPYWKVTSDGVLTLSGGTMEGSSTGDYPWLEYKSKITKIVVKDLDCIAEGAFSGMTKVTSVSLGSKLRSIGEEAFRRCSSLTTVTIPASTVEIGSSAFYLCDSLTQVKFASGSVLKEIEGSAFEGVPLKSVALPDGLETVGKYAFKDCQDLSSLSLGEGLKSIGTGAFENCFSLTEVDIPGGVEDIGWDAFKNCLKLTKLETGSPVRYYEEFTGCPITQLTVQAPMTQIRNFDDCATLTKVTLADTVVTIRDNAFSGCTALEEINWPKNLKTVEMDAFNGTALREVHLPDSVTSFSDAFSAIPTLVSFSCGPNVESIESFAFSNCKALTDVDLGNARDMGSEVFKNCTALTGITLPDELESMGYGTFWGCTSLTRITIPASVKTMGHSVFDDCTGLKEVEFLGDAPNIESEIFQNVTATVYYPAGNSTWTEEVRENCGGNVAWTCCGPEGHTFDGGVVTEPTCTQQGYTAHTCTTCGMTEKSSYTDALGHELVDQVCARCGHGSIAAPTVTASNVASTGKIRLTWNKVDGAVKYQVYRADSAEGPFSLKYTATGTGYTNTGAKAGQTFWYYVVAVSETGNTAASNTVSRTCTLAAPEITTSNVASSGKIRVTWDKVDGAVKYEVYRASSKNGEYSLKYTTTGTGYTNTGAKAGQTFYYKVKAVASDPEVSSALSAAQGRICDLARPVARIGNDAATGKIVLAWDPIPGAVKYQVMRSNYDHSYQYLEATEGTRFVDTTSEAGVKYYYKVYAVAENSNANSAQSASKTRVGDLAQPEITVIRNAKGKPNVRWEAVPGAVKYQVYRATSLNGTYSLKYTTTGTGYTNTGAADGVNYYYKVRAVCSNTSGNSAFSEAKCPTAGLEVPEVSITLTNKGKPRLSWSKVEGAAKYQVYRATSPNGTYSLKYTTTGTGYSNTGAAAGTTYYYKVKAVAADGTTVSAYSDVVFINCSTVGISDSVAAKAVINRINEWREYAGLSKLQWYEEGLDAAKIRAAELEVLPSDVERPDGSSPEKLWQDYGVTIELCLVTQSGTAAEDLVDALMLEEELEEFGIVCLLDIWSSAVAARNGDYWIIMFAE